MTRHDAIKTRVWGLWRYGAVRFAVGALAALLVLHVLGVVDVAGWLWRAVNAPDGDRALVAALASSRRAAERCLHPRDPGAPMRSTRSTQRRRRRPAGPNTPRSTIALAETEQNLHK